MENLGLSVFLHPVHPNILLFLPNFETGLAYKS